MDERTLNDLLECSVCLERLNTTSKVLPCQHTFCRKCLEVIVKSHNELRCPECRVLVEIKIDDLPPNVLLMRILEGMKHVSNQTNGTNLINSSLALNPNKQSNTTNSNNLSLLEQQSNSSNLVNILHGNNRSIDESSAVRPQSEHHQQQTQQQSQQQQQTPPSQLQQYQQQPQILSNKPFLSNATALPFSPSPNATNLPYAKALFDFLAKEPGDLSFKKGDKIYLRRRIDSNWFIGEVNGREGAFPINHVQVITPLPLAQCKAMYDFRMSPNEEEGCLAFKKGAIINVFRRVDQNWAEGRIGDCIGIFPIAFVEMNALAKQVLDVSKYIYQAVSPRTVPPTPSTEHDTLFSSETSSTITSPNSSTTSNTSSNSSTAPSSPIANLQTSPSQLNHNVAQAPLLPASSSSEQKRDYSFSSNVSCNNTNSNSVTATSSNVNSKRHSMEILNPISSKQTSSHTESAKSKDKVQKHSSKTVNDTNQHDNTTKHSSNKTGSSSKQSYHAQRHHTSSSNTPTNAVVALYPYKPQKTDELELKKGSVYYVTERCQDGWFKGTNRALKSGVFPGNYVAPLRNHRSGDQNMATKRSTNSTNNSSESHSVQVSSQRSENHFANHQENLPVPDLPPRSGGSTTTTSSVWSKPLGQHVEAFFGRKSNQEQSSKTIKESKSGVSNNNSKKEQNVSFSPTIPVPLATVNLIKRITNMKRSKSPVNCSATGYSMDNPVFEDIAGGSSNTNALASTTSCSSKRNTIHLSHPIHVRSGSCPSQILQSLPVEINMSTGTNKNNESTSSSSSYMFGSQRIKGHKERPTLHGLRNSIEANRLMKKAIDSSPQTSSKQHSNGNFVKQQSSTSSSSSYHRKSQSLDAATIASQLGNGSSALSSQGAAAVAAANKNKTHTHKERFRCIVSYPPNSEFELELQVGDIVYVHKKRDNGWYKGSHARTGKIGLFPSSFVEPDI